MWRASRLYAGIRGPVGRPAGRAQPSGRARASGTPLSLKSGYMRIGYKSRIKDPPLPPWVKHREPSGAARGRRRGVRARRSGAEAPAGGGGRRAGRRRDRGGFGSVCVTGKRTYLNLPLADPHISGEAARGSVGLFPQLPLKPPTTKRVSAAVRPERYRYRKLGTNSIAADQRGIQIPPLHPTLATGGPSPRRQASRPRAASPRGGQPPAP